MSSWAVDFMRVRGKFQQTIAFETDGLRFSFLVKDSESNFDGIIISCYGKVMEYHRGYDLILIGDFKDNVFFVASYQETISVSDFLSSQGIDKKISLNLSQIEGIENFSPSKLSEIYRDRFKKEAPLPILAKAQSDLQIKKVQFELHTFLAQFNILKTPILVKRYGKDAKTKVLSDPYQTLNGLEPFLVMDEIGFFQGFSHRDKKRIRGIVLFVMNKAASCGSTWVDLDRLCEEANTLSLRSVYGTKVPIAGIFLALAESSCYFVKENKVYFRELWEREYDIANGVKRLKDTRRKLPFASFLIDEEEITYSDEQRDAFAILNDTGVKVLTGGPGTGKTTLVNGLIKVYEKMCPEGKITLCAPTGMASSQLSKKCHRHASTIHQLLNIRPYGEDSNCRDGLEPLDSDFVIVDEMSMADTKLTGILFDSLKSGTLLLFVGDVDQLNSVGQGTVLADLIASKIIPCYKLKTLFRQSKSSLIAVNAEKINHKDYSLEKGEAFQIIETDNPEKFICAANPFFCQVLSPIKKGQWGTYHLNNFIQSQIDFKTSKTVEINGFVYHAGEKVMTTVNNYDAGYMNGDIGTLEFGEKDIYLLLNGQRICLQKEWFSDILPAYAITIHKSQGSEFDEVIICLPKQTNMLDRSLLYTAVTRAKLKVTILCEPGAISFAIAHDNRIKRQTGLVEKLQAA